MKTNYPDYLAERDYYDSVIGAPSQRKYIGDDKPKVERHTDPSTVVRGRGYPFEAGLIDYDPNTDEDLEENE